MITQLFGGHHFQNFFHGAKTAGQRNKNIRFSRQFGFAFTHIGSNDVFIDFLPANAGFMNSFGNNAGYPRAVGLSRTSGSAHQSHAGAAIYQSVPFPGNTRSQFSGYVIINGVEPVAGGTKDTDILIHRLSFF